MCLKGQSHGEWPKQGSVPPEPPDSLWHQLSEHRPQMMQTRLPGNPRGLTVKRPVELMLATLLDLPACLSVTISCSPNTHGGRGDSEQGPPAPPASRCGSASWTQQSPDPCGVPSGTPSASLKPVWVEWSPRLGRNERAGASSGRGSGLRRGRCPRGSEPCPPPARSLPCSFPPHLHHRDCLQPA